MPVNMEQDCTKITPTPEVTTRRRRDLTSSPSQPLSMSVPSPGRQLRPRQRTGPQEEGNPARTSGHSTGSVEDGVKLFWSLPPIWQHDSARLQKDGPVDNSSTELSRPLKRQRNINPKKKPGQPKASCYTPQLVVDGNGNKILRFKYTLKGKESLIQVNADTTGVDLERDLTSDFKERHACYPKAIGKVDTKSEYRRRVNDTAWKLKFINPHGVLEKGRGILQRAAEAYLEVNGQPSRRARKLRRNEQRSTSIDTGHVTDPALAPRANRMTSSAADIMPPPLLQPMDDMAQIPIGYYAKIDERSNAEGDQAHGAWAYGGGSYES